MGAVFTVLDTCGTTSLNTPSDYIDYELARESRIIPQSKKKRMDIMGTAMYAAVDDLKHLIGMREHHSDNEEKVEDDEDYVNMSILKRKYLTRRRRDSD